MSTCLECCHLIMGKDSAKLQGTDYGICHEIVDKPDNGISLINENKVLVAVNFGCIHFAKEALPPPPEPPKGYQEGDGPLYVTNLAGDRREVPHALLVMVRKFIEEGNSVDAFKRVEGLLGALDPKWHHLIEAHAKKIEVPITVEDLTIP